MPIHSKYSVILNVVFVTFTYGIAYPILFPIACLFMLNTYIADKIQLAKFYRKPPLYDDRLIKSAYGYLQYAPLMMMFFGYWFLSNQQMFYNSALAKDYNSEAINPMHSYFKREYLE